jgi:hypothetical protein
MEHPTQGPIDDYSEDPWVVWCLEVRDPQQLTPDGLADRTQHSMTELAGSLGCVFDHCDDYDSMDGTPASTYYAWFVRVPQAEHQRRGPDSLPVAIRALYDHLRSQLPPALTDWRLEPDRNLTRRAVADVYFKDVYADVIQPLEVALLGLRRDGAEKLDPHVYLWAQDGEAAGATYALWLCKSPDDPSWWLYLQVGYLAGEEIWNGPLGRGFRRFGVSPQSPILTFPRPETAMWVARVETARIPPGALVTDLVFACHQWIAADGEELADRVARDLTSLFPRLA